MGKKMAPKGGGAATKPAGPGGMAAVLPGLAGGVLALLAAVLVTGIGGGGWMAAPGASHTELARQIKAQDKALGKLTDQVGRQAARIAALEAARPGAVEPAAAGAGDGAAALAATEAAAMKAPAAPAGFEKTVLHADPLVYTMGNFLSPAECAHFIELGRSKGMQQALVSADKKGVVSAGRTGQNAWVPHASSKVSMAVAQRVCDLVGYSIDNAENFQMIHYDKTQQYRQHYDGWLHDGSNKAQRNMKRGGQRMVTALCYLSTVPSGGGTTFPRLNITSKAVAGKLLVFSDVINGTTTRHPDSEHAGDPVVEGDKWAFNLWFRERSRVLPGLGSNGGG